jgi:hypothetical protein
MADPQKPNTPTHPLVTKLLGDSDTPPKSVHVTVPMYAGRATVPAMTVQYRSMHAQPRHVHRGSVRVIHTDNSGNPTWCRVA